MLQNDYNSVQMYLGVSSTKCNGCWKLWMLEIDLFYGLRTIGVRRIIDKVNRRQSGLVGADVLTSLLIPNLESSSL